MGEPQRMFFAVIQAIGPEDLFNQLSLHFARGMYIHQFTTVLTQTGELAHTVVMLGPPIPKEDD